MAKNVYDLLMERGYVEQATHEDEIRDLLSKESVTFYIGFDATADSLHVGHFIQIMVMAHMQRHGHRPIVLLGGGTTLVGDPSGRTDMRKMLTMDDINNNAAAFKVQFEKFLDFSEGKAIMDNNADWLVKLNYVELLREVGVHFSVNRMLSAEAFKSRMERGLSFLEFNYMIMQAYDFLELYRRHNCKMQFGGNDQWSNIIAGVDLTRKVERASVFGLTFALLTNSEGNKMGKTANGALWLDANKTSPYEFFQYWRNIDDADVEKCMRLLTFLPLDEIAQLCNVEGKEINNAKEKLAFEITQAVHGTDEANKALDASRALFSDGIDMSEVPTFELPKTGLGEGVTVVNFLKMVGLTSTSSEGRRLVEQGGCYLAGERTQAIDQIVTTSDFTDGSLLVRKGKKVYLVVKLV